MRMLYTKHQILRFPTVLVPYEQVCSEIVQRESLDRGDGWGQHRERWVRSHGSEVLVNL